MQFLKHLNWSHTYISNESLTCICSQPSFVNLEELNINVCFQDENVCSQTINNLELLPKLERLKMCLGGMKCFLFLAQILSSRSKLSTQLTLLHVYFGLQPMEVLSIEDTFLNSFRHVLESHRGKCQLKFLSVTGRVLTAPMLCSMLSMLTGKHLQHLKLHFLNTIPALVIFPFS